MARLITLLGKLKHFVSGPNLLIRLACTSLNVNVAKLLDFIKAREQNSSKTMQTFAIDVDVDEQLQIIAPDGTKVFAQAVNLFVDVDLESNVNWYFDSTKVVTPFAIGTTLKVAGSLNQIGLNIQSVNVSNAEGLRDCMKRLIPPADPDADPFNICVHIEKGRIAPSELLTPISDVRFSTFVSQTITR